MTDDLKKPQLRAIQYFYVDGSFEFGFGLLCLLLGVYFFVETHVHGWLSALVDSSLVLVMLGGAWLINRLVKRLKEKVTYPRTGYVAYRRERGPARVWRVVAGMVCGGLVAAVAAVVMTIPHPVMNVWPLFIALVMAILLGFLGFRSALPRLYLLGGVSLIAGIALAFSGLESYVAAAVYYLLLSLALFISGGLTLWRYLRRNPPSEGVTV